MRIDPSDSPDLERLAAFGTPGGPALDEGLGLFASLRKTPHERCAIDRLLALDMVAPLPDPLLVAVASALLDRGDKASAARVLARATSSAGLILRADLAVRAGDLGAAVALVERVMARDIDWPGARERHTRWVGELGAARPDVQSWENVVASVPDSPFDVLREAGRGGAGAVHEAIDRALGRRVALKTYHHPDRDRAQLLHEARVAVALSGPGIVRVFDVDPDHGWLAMEWAHFGALGTLLRTRQIGPLSPVARWAVPLAAALARIHAAGWVHHDMKPANVLLCESGEPLVSDFGSARRMGQPSPPGSLGYVSPERLAGRTSDPRDDVYGFGRVLEDAIDALGEAEACAWSALAVTCAGPDETRPRDGAELLARAALEARVLKG
jgi:serine/threonine-protein kinase